MYLHTEAVALLSTKAYSLDDLEDLPTHATNHRREEAKSKNGGGGGRLRPPPLIGIPGAKKELFFQRVERNRVQKKVLKKKSLQPWQSWRAAACRDSRDDSERRDLP